MTPEETEALEVAQRNKQAELNAAAAERAKLEAKYGQVWNTEEMKQEFSPEGFGAPCIVVRRKSDNVRGSLYFQHSPRFYFSFKAA